MKIFLRSSSISLLLTLMLSSAAFGASVFFEADEYRSNFDTKITEGRGNVEVRFGGRHLTADYVQMDQEANTLVAEGNVQYNAQGIVATASRMQISTQNNFGSFENATLRIADSFYIEAKTLEHYDTDKYRVWYGKVSPCMDCPQAWSMAGSYIDVEIEGYAEAHNAIFQIKDMPFAYFPVFYFPVKQRRQSGLLIPQFSQEAELGSSFSQSYFWAINEHSDSTFDYRFMRQGGHKLSTEYRYQHSQRTFVRGRFSGLDNLSVPDVPQARYGYSLEQRFQISPNWVQRFRGELASDTRYTTNFENEFRAALTPALSNEASLSWQSTNFFALSLVDFQKNNLQQAPPPLPDKDMSSHLHRLPALSAGMASMRLAGPLFASLELSSQSFRRPGPSFDPETGWIRTGDRAGVELNFVAPLSLDYFSWEPRLEMRTDAYRFDKEATDFRQAPQSAGRFRYMLDQKVEMDIWRVYQRDGQGNIGAIRHSLNPFVRWTYSDRELRKEHPFFDDEDAPRFDLFDPNSEISAIRLGTIGEEQRLREHHLLTLGFQTRLVGRFQDSRSRSYRQIFRFGIDRDYDFRLSEWSRIKIDAVASVGSWTLSSSASIDPKKKEMDARNELRFRQRIWDISVFQRAGPQTELYGGSIGLRRWGPISLSTGLSYDATDNVTHDHRHQISYLSPSRCWSFAFAVTRRRGQEAFSYMPEFGITFSESPQISSL